ncbi:hypothetical protein FE784_31385 [Paenibacillus hemerocallicola]|uniref:ParA family protein n=1 Tax=Paenibacillus hemerocallicola TaxID=1172614 RepID=A0A5C4SZZ7_9BACL|nr:hypothetical protein [Paenibacillus hemerocallicola]TNJ62293.1 hypothetical protein FE784_31385 [Paenibacillus hemerocallicola]
MQIAFVTQDEVLVQDWVSGKVREEDRLHWFQQPDALSGSLEALVFDHIVLSDRYFGLAGFCDYVEQVKEVCPGAVFTVLLSDRHDANENGKWIKYCIVNGIHYVLPHRTRESINGVLLQRFYGNRGDIAENGSKSIVFVGSTPNIGTTFVSFGTAVGLACRTARSVAYLCLNLKSSKLHRYIGIEKPEASLDQLRAEIRSRSLRPERLRSYCETVKGVPNLRVLFGNQLREQAEFFTAEDIEHLLQTAKRTFDVCIVEVNAYWDNAATVCALLQAESRILVTTPDLTHFQEDTDRWLRGLSPIIGLNADSFDLVLTQADKNGNSAGIRQRDIRKETGLSFIGKVGKYADLTEAVNQGKLLDVLLGQHPMCRDLVGIVSLLTALCGFETAVQLRSHPVNRLFARLFAKPGKAGRTLWGS